jgi:hypothetical protein
LSEGAGWTAPAFWGLLALAGALLAALAWVEPRAPDPILPLHLLRDRLFAVANGHGFMAGFAVWGGWVFIPLYTQAVLGTTAVEAGISIMPMDLTWVVASIIGSRLLLSLGYRSIALSGMAATVAGMIGLSQVGSATPYWWVLVCSGLIGVGMGFSIPAFTIAVQSTVPRSALGTATSSLQFSRNIGGTLGTSIMGVLMASRLAAGLQTGGLSPDTVSLGELLDPLASVDVSATLALVRDALAAGVRDVFVAASIAAAVAWAITALAPRGRLGDHPAAATAEPQTAGSPSGLD